MIVKRINKILVVIVGLVLFAACFLTVEAQAAAFVEKKPEGLMVTATKGKIAVSWEKVAGAQMYDVYRAKEVTPAVKAGSEGLAYAMGTYNASRLRYKKISETAKTKLIVKKSAKGYDYHFYVVAKRMVVVNGNGTMERSQRSNIRSTTMPLTGKSTIKTSCAQASALWEAPCISGVEAGTDLPETTKRRNSKPDSRRPGENLPASIRAITTIRIICCRGKKVLIVQDL